MVAHSGAVVATGVVVMMGEVIAAAAAVNGGLLGGGGGLDRDGGGDLGGLERPGDGAAPRGRLQHVGGGALAPPLLRILLQALLDRLRRARVRAEGE